MLKSIYQNKISIRYENLNATLYQLPNGKAVIQFENHAIDEIILSHSELEEALALGQLHFISKKESPKGEIKLTPKQKVEQERRNAYINAVKEQSEPNSKNVGGLKKRKAIIAKVAELIGDNNPPSPSTLGVWCQNENEKSLGAAHDIIAPNRRKRSPKFDGEVQLSMLEAIDEQLAGNLIDKINLTELHRLLAKKITSLNKPIHVPSYSYVKKTFKKLIWEILPRSGIKATELKALARNAIRKFKVKFPLDRVEADGVYLQVGIVDENGNYLGGGVTIIFIIDVKTRVILGYSARVGRGETSSLVIQAIRHALCPKPEGSFHTKKGNRWGYYGLFSCFVADGGTAFTSIETSSFLMRICGTLTKTLPAAAGWLKPFIERFNLTLRIKFAKKMPGYVGPMEDQMQLEFSMKDNAVLTFEEFKQRLERWIVDDYHHTPHSGIKGLTPDESWQESLDSGWRPELPPNYEQIALPCGKVRFAAISGDKKGSFHLGVQVENIRYNDMNARLKDIARHLTSVGEKPIVRCEYDDIDISKISVLDPRTDEYFIVPTVDADIEEGMTREAHQAELKVIKDRMSRPAPDSFSDDEDSDKLKAKLAAKNSGKKHSRQRDAIPDDYLEAVNKQSESNSYTPPKSFSSQSLLHLSSPLDDIDEDDDGIFESD